MLIFKSRYRGIVVVEMLILHSRYRGIILKNVARVHCTYYKPQKLITFAGGDDEKDAGGDVHDHIHCQP